jgi:Ca2+-binding EF-hand superfamily protein
LKAAQEDAHKLLQDPVAFNKRFEELFTKYDKNRDGLIGFEEYRAFISEMLISMGRTKVQSQLLLTYFQRADNDSSGQIEKEEFRKEFKKRLREFYMMNF